jgi:hypothetical protein
MTELDTVVRRQKPKRDIPAIGNDDDVVLTFSEWYALAGISEAAAREMRARGEGPRCVKLTEKKLGVTLAEHRKWVKKRME